jgi:hypothetical protein
MRAITPLHPALLGTTSRCAAWCCLLCWFALVLPGRATAQPRFELAAEGGLAFQARNDVQIPNDADGTRFALDEVIGPGPFPAVRASVRWNITPRHSLRATYAPLRVTETGTLDEATAFAGETFGAGEVEATYQFNAPRLTYRFLFVDGAAWQLGVGFTALIRDAEIRLEQDGRSANDTDVGFVPLLHLYGAYAFTPRWRAVLDFDGLAAPQGRAFDAALTLRYAASDRFYLEAGYRLLEGGADNDTVYNFAWFNFAVAGVGVRL